MAALTRRLQSGPVAAVARVLSEGASEGFLFDSPPLYCQGGNLPYRWRDGRVMFGLRPQSVLTIRASERHPLECLDAFLSQFDHQEAAIAAGFLSYDLGGILEPSAASRKPPTAEPLVYMALYHEYFEYDAAARVLLHCDRRGQHQLCEFPQEITSPVPRGKTAHYGQEVALASDFTPDAYRNAVSAARDYILAGDVFEVNLSQRFTTPLPCGAGDLYLRLREENPAPYAAFLSCAGTAVLSSSPELFLRVDGEMVTTRPIKGTARRAIDAGSDAHAARTLAASQKDNAELAMVIDLERNDLGRVCRYGSVRVAERARVETFAHVHHLVSTVEGRLRNGVTLGRILGAAFPGGSITGAPKVRAMQIIDELEPCRRGVYTGAIGYVLPGGRSEFNIAIRTIVCTDGVASFHVGGAVTAESDPQAEFDETMAKARGMVAAIRSARTVPAAVYGETPK